MNIVEILIEKINKGESTGFVKFGDGEYFCMAQTYPGGHNVDQDNFTEKKGDALKNAFRFFVNDYSNTIFIGKWHSDNWNWNQFLNNDKQTISWANYHTLLLDGDNMQQKLELYRTIKLSVLQKIYIGNSSLKDVQQILNVDYFIEIAPQNWFDHDYDNILNKTCNHLSFTQPTIIMTSAGMAAKILLADVLQRYPNTIILDFGSAFDCICRGHPSRTWEPPRRFLLELLSCHQII